MQVDPDVLGQLVDVSVYTKDREMRTIGASKFGKPGSALELVRELGPGRTSADAVITWLDGGCAKLLEVPCE